MNRKPDKTIKPFSPSERRAALRKARDTGELPYDQFDRLMIESAVTPAKLNGLLRSLKGVRLAPAEDPEDILAQPLETLALESATEGHFARYMEQIRQMQRMTRSEEHA